MRSALAAVSAALLLLAMTGCTAAPPVSAPTSPAASSAAPTPSPPPAPGKPGTLTIAVDGVTFEGDGETRTAGFTDGQAIIDLLHDTTGSLPDGVAVDDLEGYESGVVVYDWDGIAVFLAPDGRARVSVEAPSIGAVRIQTVAGLGVGSSRTDAVKAQAWDQWDDDGDGLADYLGIGEREVPGTESLSRPDFVGIEFVLLVMEDDAVTEIQAPADDFSDL